jgi:hypothetical protein
MEEAASWFLSSLYLLFRRALAVASLRVRARDR